MSKMDTLLTKEIGRLGKWVRKPLNKEIMRDDPLKTVHSLPRRLSEDHLVDLKMSLEFLSTWEANIGLYDVLKGKESGWESIYTGWYYGAWAFRMWLAFCQAEAKGIVGLSRSISTGSQLLAGAVAFGHYELPRLAAQLLATHFNGHLEISPKTFSTPFESYMVHLLSKISEVPLTIAPGMHKKLRAYQHVIEAWETDERAFNDGVVAICDYHCSQMIDGDALEEFVGGPFNLFPVDVLATLRLHGPARSGQDNPAHALMALSSANVPPKLTLACDPNIAKAISAFKNHYPTIEDWAMPI